MSISALLRVWSLPLRILHCAPRATSNGGVLAYRRRRLCERILSFGTVRSQGARTAGLADLLGLGLGSVPGQAAVRLHCCRPPVPTP